MCKTSIWAGRIVPVADTDGIRNRRDQSETTLNLADGARLPWGSGIAMMERIM